ncbi:MAG: GNAT family protein [Phycisphaerae bacterium]
MAAQPQIESPRFVLAHYRPAFAAPISTWATSESELRWLAPATPPPLTPQKVHAWTPDGRRRYVVWDRAVRTVVGHAELDFLSPDTNRMWIGHFVLAPGVRGRGLATRFANGLLHLAFGQFDAAEVVLLVFPDNEPAIRCYRRAGFVDAGVEHKYFEHSRMQCALTRMGIDRAAYRRAEASVAGVGPRLACQPDGLA